MEKIAEKLREIISREGQDYLEDHPWEVFEELKNAKAAKKEILAVVLMTLVIGVPTAARKEPDAVKLSVQIAKKTCLTKKMTDQLAQMYCDLFSAENEEMWEEQDRAGLKAFLKNVWTFKWRGDSVWDYGNGELPCYYKAEAELQVGEGGIQDKAFGKLIEKNPFMTEEQITAYFEKDLARVLNREIEDYVTSDDYYEPWMPDFECESYIEDWAKEHGFELLSFEGDGDTGDYESRRRSWY